MKNLVIIWGSDGFGSWLAWYIKKNFKDNINLTITWRNQSKLEKTSKKIWCNFSTNNTETIKKSDITVFCVPVSKTEEIIEKYAPQLKKWSVVLDVTSIKKWPSLALKKFSPKWVLIIPTHPMFWPFVSTISWQIIVLTAEKETQKDPRYHFLKNFLEKKWAKVVEESPLEHDKMMAVVQWLTHFNMFVLAQTMRKLNFSIEKSLNFVSPIYKIMISSVGRYVSQNPKLYADIQMNNTEVLKVHKCFMKSTSIFNDFVEQKKEELFIKTIEKSKDYFAENSEKWQKYTDKIIFMLWKQSEIVEKNIWNILIFENIYTWEILKQTVKKYDNPNIYLKNGLTLNIDEYNIIKK